MLSCCCTLRFMLILRSFRCMWPAVGGDHVQRRSSERTSLRPTRRCGSIMLLSVMLGSAVLACKRQRGLPALDAALDLQALPPGSSGGCHVDLHFTSAKYGICYAIGA